jgi:hypothetical protein
MEHYYVFYKHEGDNMFDRTCGTKESAEERINILKNKYNYSDAEYFLNEIPKDYIYFY